MLMATEKCINSPVDDVTKALTANIKITPFILYKFL